MKRLVLMIAIALTGTACLPVAEAQGAFGLGNFDVTFTDQEGVTAMQAGSHPFAATTSFAVNPDDKGGLGGSIKDLVFKQVPGLLGDTTAYPRCTMVAFLKKANEGEPACPLETQVGIAAISGQADTWATHQVFNLAPSSGALLRLGFSVGAANIILAVGLNPDPPYNVIAASRNTSQLIEVLAAKIQLWGDPASPALDELRGVCGVGEVTLSPGEEFEFEGSGASCPVAPTARPLLTLPTDCSEPLASSFEAFSWEGAQDFGSRLTHGGGGDPMSFSGCGSLPIPGASISTIPTTNAAQSPTGLDFSLDVQDEGLTSVGGTSQSRIRQVVLALPEGMVLNPSMVKGLEICSEADLARETLDSAPGEGCPEASKVGTVEVESPLLDESLSGSLFLAGDNGKKSVLPSGLYIVVKNPGLGIIVKQVVEVEADPETGQLIAIAEDIPQTAVVSHFELHLREGASSLLVSPPRCGEYEVETEIAPWSGTAPRIAISSFQIVTGPGESPCPAGGAPPLQPGPGVAPAGSAASAPGNLRPSRHRCPKGKHKVHRKGKARCVERHRTKNKGRHWRGAQHNRGVAPARSGD
jgi:hypothetical protein